MIGFCLTDLKMWRSFRWIKLWRVQMNCLDCKEQRTCKSDYIIHDIYSLTLEILQKWWKVFFVEGGESYPKLVDCENLPPSIVKMQSKYASHQFSQIAKRGNYRIWREIQNFWEEKKGLKRPMTFQDDMKRFMFLGDFF